MQPKKNVPAPTMPITEANGALPTAPNESVTSRSAPATSAASEGASSAKDPLSTATSHQAHGAILPSGPILSVSQLTAGRSRALGSVGSFDTLDQYKNYLGSLSLGALHRHAVEEAKIVPIDDRSRLIRRLESEWSATASRSGSRKVASIPQPVQYTAEQTAKLNELMNKMTRR